VWMVGWVEPTTACSCKSARYASLARQELSSHSRGVGVSVSEPACAYLYSGAGRAKWGGGVW